MTPRRPTTARNRKRLGIARPSFRGDVAMKEWRNYDRAPSPGYELTGCFGAAFVKPWPPNPGALRMSDRAIHTAPAPPEASIVAALGPRAIVLVGMMGAGKSSIGRRLAQRLGITFVDADTEIEIAAGMSIADIFAIRGEPEFRTGEARGIARLLGRGAQVPATRAGAFLNDDTRCPLPPTGHPA